MTATTHTLLRAEGFSCPSCVRKIEKALDALRSRFGSLKDVDRPAAQDDFVTMNLTATVAGDEMTFLFGNREIAADDESLEVYSERSPLGEAINGAAKGDKVTYTAPNGKEIKVEIKDVKPYSG